MAEVNHSNLAWLSRAMAWLATIGVVLTPLGDAVVYLWPGTRSGLNLNADHMDRLLSEAVPLPYRLGALVFSLAAVALTVWALFASVVATFAMHAPISLILSLGIHKPQISLDFGSGDLATLFTAGVMLVIARVMNEAGRIAEENAKFV